MELIYDSRDDRYELDNLLERLPRGDRPRAVALYEEFERKHLALLERRRSALEKLASRAEQTHDQVQRRLRILDDHFGFIRTNLFWVRDEEPIGATTLTQAQKELTQLARGLLRLGADLADRSLWGRVSLEFLSAIVGLVILPWPVCRLRKFLRSISPSLHCERADVPGIESAP
jgi:potassium efflux system protein